MTKLVPVLIIVLGVIKSSQQYSLVGTAVYNVSLSRIRRQAAGSGCQSDPNQFQCRTTPDCIDSEKICDGVENCRDGSDESQDICKTIPCPDYLFKCGYGACIDSDMKCDGKKNCKDNSDESDCPSLGTKINTNCRSDEFECKNGQCVQMDARCDGIEDCMDKSDEIEELCLNTDCPDYTYKCKYGACVDGDSECNGVKNCADNSDEVNCAPVKTTPKPPVQTTPSGKDEKQCKTPPQPVNGQWVYFPDQTVAAVPNVAVPKLTAMLFRCNDGYKLSTTLDPGQIIYCENAGQWTYTKMPECQRLCPKMVNGNHLTVKCELAGSIIPCDKATSGTQVTYKCEPYFEPVTDWTVNTCGDNGNWFYENPRCREKCGEKRVAAEPLVIGGSSVIRGEYPWVVALYSNKDSVSSSSYINICGGSLLSTSIAITAAHCVTIQDNGAVIHKKFFMVSAGKYYNRYGDARDNNTAQYSSITKIVKHEEYAGQIQNFRYDIALLLLKVPFALSKVVQPVCLNLNDINESLLYNHATATVTGWGYTTTTGTPSDVLKEVDLEYVDRSQCRSELDPSFADRYLVEDKICAGHINKNTSVCQGDSGGGLVVKAGARNRYYLQGLVSLGQGALQNNQRSCRSERRALFTNVNRYSHWIQTNMQLLLTVTT